MQLPFHRSLASNSPGPWWVCVVESLFSTFLSSANELRFLFYALNYYVYAMLHRFPLSLIIHSSAMFLHFDCYEFSFSSVLLLSLLVCVYFLCNATCEHFTWTVTTYFFSRGLMWNPDSGGGENYYDISLLPFTLNSPQLIFYTSPEVY